MANLPKNNPVRFLVEAGVNGYALTDADLDRLDAIAHHLPSGNNLASTKAAILAASREVSKLGATGDREAALEAAQRHWGAIADRLDDSSRALDSTEAPARESVNVDDLDAFAADMFKNRY